MGIFIKYFPRTILNRILKCGTVKIFDMMKPLIEHYVSSGYTKNRVQLYYFKCHTFFRMKPPVRRNSAKI